MKILITSDWALDDKNGVSTSVSMLRKALGEKGHDVRILTLSKNGSSYVAQDIYYTASRSASFVYKGARMALRINRKILSEILLWKPDVIHSQCEFSTFSMAQCISRKCGAPVVHTFHTDYEYYIRYAHFPKLFNRWFSSFLFRRGARKSRLLIFPTEKTRALAESYGIKKESIVIPSAIDLSSFCYKISDDERQRERRKLGIKDGTLTLLYLGRIGEEKNIDEILAFKKAFSDYPLSLIIAGGGPYLERLKKKKDEMNLDSVIFTGMVERMDTHYYYHLADFFITASVSETQGLCVIEALSSSLPVICRDDMAYSAVSDGFNGFKYKSLEEFLQIMKKIHDNPEMIKHMRENAQKSSLEYSGEKFAERAEEAYMKALEKNNDS